MESRGKIGRGNPVMRALSPEESTSVPLESSLNAIPRNRLNSPMPRSSMVLFGHNNVAGRYTFTGLRTSPATLTSIRIAASEFGIILPLRAIIAERLRKNRP